MVRIFLEHQGNQIALDRGAHIVGRGIRCSMRLNDHTVSREHLRLDVGERDIVATDLGSRNGTLVNGRPCGANRRLRDGDVLQVGSHKICVRVVSATADDDERPEEKTASLVPEAPGQHRKPRATPVPSRSAQPEPSLALPNIEHWDCPKCRFRVPTEQRACPSCGYEFPSGGPYFITQVRHYDAQKSTNAGNRRLVPRLPVSVLVLYVSQNLSLNAVARDLSLGGVYVATDLLDEIGSSCELTFLPEGRAAVQCRGVVRHVNKGAGHDTRPTGMGIQFTHLGSGGKEWLSSLFRSM